MEATWSRRCLGNILRKAGREMPRYVVSIVRVGARLATCNSDARFGSRVRNILREVKVQKLVS